MEILSSRKGNVFSLLRVVENDKNKNVKVVENG